MKIDNKFDIGETVMFGNNQAKIISIVIYPSEYFSYKVAYLDHENKYTIVEVYNFEISKYDKNKLGFGKK